MKQCYKVKNLFGPYLYNTITIEERIEFEDHLKTCQKCSEDLKTRRMALNKVGMYEIDSENINIDQERFMWNVYKRIAKDAIKQKRRQVTVRKFILQPAIATIAIALIVTFGITKFRSNDVPESIVVGIPTVPVQVQDETIKETKQVVKAQPTVVKKAKPSLPFVTKNETKTSKPLIIKPKPDVLTAKSELTSSQDLLMDADFIYFSLGDARRALSRYDMIIDRYPNTEAAREALKRINTILSSEYGMQDENINNIELVKTGI